ncbi:MAG: hypothetical protein ACW9W4_10415 [Candidatus Nitrosopumilus sp. bin_7KS]
MLAGNLAFAQSNDYTVGEIHLPDRCYSSVDVRTVRVIDPDMNADPQKTESVPVYLWANTDVDVRNPNAVETGPDTGIFETAVFLNAYDESFSQRIRALEGDVLYARYVDETVPFDQKQVIETLVTIGALSPQQRWGEPWPERSQLHNSTYVYDACLSEFMDKVGRDNSGLDWLDVTYPAPLKQIESGLFFDEVICKDDFELAFKHDDTPACVTESTKQKLVEREWTRNIILTQSLFEDIKSNILGLGYSICDIQLNDDKITIDLHKFFKDSEPEKKIISQIPYVKYEIVYHEGYSDYFINTITSHECKGLANEN